MSIFEILKVLKKTGQKGYLFRFESFEVDEFIDYLENDSEYESDVKIAGIIRQAVEILGELPFSVSYGSRTLKIQIHSHGDHVFEYYNKIAELVDLGSEKLIYAYGYSWTDRVVTTKLTDIETHSHYFETNWV